MSPFFEVSPVTVHFLSCWDLIQRTGHSNYVRFVYTVMKPNFLILLASAAISIPSPAIAQKSPQRLFCEGYIYLREDRLGQAIVNYSQAIKSNPRYADAYFYRGVAHHMNGRYADAIANYNQAGILGYSQRELIYKNRGHALGMLNDYKQAFADLKLALDMKRDDFNYWSFALANFMTGNRQGAIRISQQMAERYYQAGNRSAYLEAQDAIKIFRTAPANKLPSQLGWMRYPEFDRPRGCP